VQLLKQFYCARKLRHKLPQFIAVYVVDLTVYAVADFMSGKQVKAVTVESSSWVIKKRAVGPPHKWRGGEGRAIDYPAGSRGNPIHLKVF